MRTSDRGIALIKGHEGLQLEAYPDPAHGWKTPTIGYGHTSAAGSPSVTRGMKITAAGADAILRDDLRKFEGYVANAVHVPLTQSQFDALVSFTFNLGPGNLRKSTLLRRVNALDYSGAADEFRKWNKAGGKVMAGLTRRRDDERKLFLSDSAHSPARPVTPSKPAPDYPPAASPVPAPNATVVIVIIAVGALIAAFFGFK